MKGYIGFYTSRPFWAGTRPKFNEISQEKFTDIMSQEVFIFKNDDYEIKICKDGLFLFRLEAIARDLDQARRSEKPLDFEIEVGYWSKYLHYLNTIYLLFELSILKKIGISYFEISEITNKDAFSIQFNNEKFDGCSISDLSIISYYQQGRFLHYYKLYEGLNTDQSILMDQRIAGRLLELTQDAFDSFVDDFTKIYNDFKSVEILSDFTKALSEYKIANYSVSFVLSWFIIESYLNDKWRTLLRSKNFEPTPGIKRINSERMKYLQDRDFHISVIQNLLELFDVLELPKCKKIDKLRKIRNKLVHGDENSCHAQDCSEAFKIITDFILEHTNISLQLNTSRSIRGL